MLTRSLVAKFHRHKAMQIGIIRRNAESLHMFQRIFLACFSFPPAARGLHDCCIDQLNKMQIFVKT